MLVTTFRLPYILLYYLTNHLSKLTPKSAMGPVQGCSRIVTARRHPGGTRCGGINWLLRSEEPVVENQRATLPLYSRACNDPATGFGTFVGNQQPPIDDFGLELVERTVGRAITNVTLEVEPAAVTRTFKQVVRRCPAYFAALMGANVTQGQKLTTSFYHVAVFLRAFFG